MAKTHITVKTDKTISGNPSMKRIGIWGIIILLLLPLHLAAADGEPLLGDVDGDGSVTRTDARLLLQNVLEGRDSYPVWYDFDLDGFVTATDASAILRYLDSGIAFPVSGILTVQNAVLYSGTNSTILATFSDSRFQVHIAYDSSDRIDPGFYSYRITLSKGNVRLPGEWRGAFEVVMPYFDLGSIDLSDRMEYFDLKNEFASHEIDVKQFQKDLPDGLSGTVSISEEPYRTGFEDTYLVTIELSDASGLYQPIPKLYRLLHVRDLWSDWR